MGSDSIELIAGGLAPHELTSTLQELRKHLDSVGFHGLYKNLVGVLAYYTDPGRLRAGSTLVEFSDRLTGDSQSSRHALSLCLCTHHSVEESNLSLEDRKLAALLERAGFFRKEGTVFHGAQVQLISWNNLYLLLDARLNFGGAIHELYVGLDSYLLAYYLEDRRIEPGCRFLDLCTGTGLIGMFAANRGAEVISTDIAPFPLRMAAWNMELNRLTDKIELRNESMRDTLSVEAKTYDFVACNPPFVSTPQELPDLGIYAQGTEPDGLGYLRWLFQESWGVLSDNGVCAQVADLPGTPKGPGFLEELEEIALKHHFQVDCFVDNKLPVAANGKVISSFLSKLDPSLDPQDVSRKVADHYKSVLRADYFYLTTMIAKRSERPGLEVFNRYRSNGILHRARASEMEAKVIDQVVPIRRTDAGANSSD